MTRWLDVGAVAELSFRPGAAVRVGDRWIGVFRTAAGYRAIENACPHAAAPLCDGTQLGDSVVCFLHCWTFDLHTGACDVGAEWNVATYPVREVAGRLQIEMPDA